ncbi:glycosyl hydrolase family 8 [Caulobacter sp.]|uniref:glycosyl hydrolase family 8 n=1 Tax=Caulobacter sp. TaxID=78 RepID=UPI002B49CAB0|nr:glycosyl hydrolase family 8 [Caulobacter sp.]HJV42707.1 glycosyl hydrolase family 8 [Caulobacter sp.]
MLLIAALTLQAVTLSACAAAPSPPNWVAYKTRFVLPEGRVVDTGNGNISHSEGQGFAMVMATAYDDPDTFKKLWSWTDKTLSRPDTRLFRWRYEPAGDLHVGDPNNALDGDLLIAWALLRGGERWRRPEYVQASVEIRKAILGKLLVRQGDRTLLAPGMDGFVHPDGLIINPSYAIMPALDAFAAREPRSQWPSVRDQALRALRDARFGAADLPVDWVRVDGAGAMWTDPDRPPRFGFDAVRVPLYLCWSGRCGDATLDPVKRWWASFRTAGKPAPAWIDVRTGEVAPFAASVGMASVADLALTGRASTASIDGEDYYSSSLLILTQIAAQERREKPTTVRKR